MDWSTPSHSGELAVVNTAPHQSAPLPLFVLTGFLGSGKTTLLNRLLADPAMHDTAVIVNEFGEIGIDHLLVSAVSEDVVLLASGCVCCTAGEDFGTALASLLIRRSGGSLPPFGRIVLETTGIADPALLLQRVLSDAALMAQIRIEAVITVVDAVFGEATLSRCDECATQVAMANDLVLSKTDLADGNGVDSLMRSIRSINPAAPILRCEHDGPSAERLFGDIRPPASQSDRISDAIHHHAGRYSTFWLAWDEPTEWEDFRAWLEGLLIARGDSILRLKGILQVVGSAQPLIIQGVQHALYRPTSLPGWPRGMPRSEIVFVTRDFSRLAALRSIEQILPFHITVG
jgi:G3E family GTPase